MSEPIRTTVVRYKCPHCNRHESRKAKAVAHIARCFLNPANRTCRTCKHHIDVNWVNPEGCKVSEPAEFPVVGCPLWELAVSS